MNAYKTVTTVDVCIVHADTVLMLRRSAHKKAFPGWMAFPGGHIEDGENPMAAALREAKEETGISLDERDMKLKFVAFHSHIDRGELYIVFGFRAALADKPETPRHTAEGELLWLPRSEITREERILPPVKYYCDHVMNNRQGVIYNSSVWEHSRLVRVTSEHIDRG